MDCRQAQEQLYELLEGKPETPSRSKIESHLASCGPCRVEKKKLQDTLLLLDRAAPPPLSPGFQQDVLKRIASVPAPKRSLASRIRDWLVFPAMKWTLEGLAAATVVLFAVVLIREFSPRKPLPLETAPRGLQMDAPSSLAPYPIMVQVSDLAEAKNKMVGLVKAHEGKLVRSLPQGNEIQVVFRLPKEKEVGLIGTLREWGAQNLDRNAFLDETGNWVVILRKR